MEYLLVMKREWTTDTVNNVDKYRNILLSKKSQIEKRAYCTVLFIWNSRALSHVYGRLGLRGWRLRAKEYEESFWGDGKVLYLYWSGGYADAQGLKPCLLHCGLSPALSEYSLLLSHQGSPRMHQTVHLMGALLYGNHTSIKLFLVLVLWHVNDSLIRMIIFKCPSWPSSAQKGMANTKIGISGWRLVHLSVEPVLSRCSHSSLEEV